MDPLHCVLLGLGVWLEVFLTQFGMAERTPYVFGWNPDLSVPDGGDKVKNQIQTIFLEEVFCFPELQSAEGPLGSHSIRKHASTHTRKNGCTKDEKDLRGRWKKGRHISDGYDEIDLPHPDAKVASKLCIGGPCKCAVKAGAGVSDAFILQHVVPAIRSRCSDDLALVLGKAVLWLACSDGKDYLPPAILNRINNAYSAIRQLPENENPIEKIMLVVTGNEGVVHYDEVGGELLGGAGGRNGAPLGDMDLRNQMLGLQSQMSALRRIVEENRVANGEQVSEMNRHLRNMSSNMRRLANQPAFRVANNNVGGNAENRGAAVANPAIGVPFASTLSPNPRTIHLLWVEYEIGIGGRKPARDFTRVERGRVKHKYHRRKLIWDCVSRLVRAGLTAQVACDRMHQVYGEGSPVTTIINRMKADKRNGIVHDLLEV